MWWRGGCRGDLLQWGLVGVSRVRRMCVGVKDGMERAGGSEVGHGYSSLDRY